MSRKSGEVPSIANHQSNPPRYTGGFFSFNPNSPDRRQQSRGGIIRRQRVQGSGGARPASESFISHPEQRGQSAERLQSRLPVHYQPLSQKETQSGNSYNSNPSIVSSQNLIWQKDAPKSHNEVKVPGNDEISLVSQPGKYWSNSRSKSTPRAPRGGFRETNELSAVGVKSTSNGIQSNKMFSSASQTAARAPSASRASDTSAFRSNPRSGKVAQTPSGTDFSLWLNSMTSRDTSRPKMVQSYLFKDSKASSLVTGDEQQAMATKQRDSDAQDRGRLSSNFVKLLRNDPIEGDNAASRPKMVQSYLFKDSRASSLVTGDEQQAMATKQRDSDAQDRGRLSLNFVKLLRNDPIEGDNAASRPKMVQSYLFKDSRASSMVTGDEQQAMATKQRDSDAQDRGRLSSNFVKLLRNDPIEGDNANPLHFDKNVAQDRPQTHSLRNYPPVSSTYPPAQPSLHPTSGKGRTLEKVVPAPLAASQDNDATSREKYPAGSSELTARGSAPGSEPDRSKKSIYGVSGFKNLRSKSGRYSFNNGKVYNKYPSVSLGRIQTTTVSPPSPLPSGLKHVQPLLPESNTSPDMNPDPTQVTSKVMSGFTARPLEGATPPVREPDRPATRWRGVEIEGSQTWQAKHGRIDTWMNDTRDLEAESNSPSTQRQKEQSSEDVKRKYEHSRFTPDKYKKRHNIYTFMGFPSLRGRVGRAHLNNTTAAPPTSIVPSSHLRSAAGLHHLESSPTTEPRTHDKTKPVATRAGQFYRIPNGMGIGKRVQAKPDGSQKLSGSSFPANYTVDVAIVRLPKLKVTALTFADSRGLLSFGGVRATTQTPMTPADKKDYFTRAPAETGQEEGPSRGAKDEVVDSSRLEEKTSGLQSRAFEGGMKTLDTFLDNEGSGSGAFNVLGVFDVFSDRPQSQSLIEDLLELEFDYLRTATVDSSFKSVKLSRPER